MYLRGGSEFTRLGGHPPRKIQKHALLFESRLNVHG
jgi:hypothetical protein